MATLQSSYDHGAITTTICSARNDFSAACKLANITGMASLDNTGESANIKNLALLNITDAALSDINGIGSSAGIEVYASNTEYFPACATVRKCKHMASTVLKRDTCRYDLDKANALLIKEDRDLDQDKSTALLIKEDADLDKG